MSYMRRSGRRKLSRFRGCERNGSPRGEILSGAKDLLEAWCREGDLNPHSPFVPADFKSAASANFAIPANCGLEIDYRNAPQRACFWRAGAEIRQRRRVQ